MSIPYQIADTVEFGVQVCTGLQNPAPVVDSSEMLENTLDLMLRSDPRNPADLADETTWIFVGNGNRQDFPLRPNESINVHVTKRNGIYFRGPQGHRLHVVSAQVRPSE